MRIDTAMRSAAVQPQVRVPAVPWYDQATLIRTTGADIIEGGRVIVVEGALHRVVEVAAAFSPAELARHFISLPDRQSAPHRYEGDALARLLGRIDRPGARNFIGR